MNIPDDILIEGVRRAVEGWLAGSGDKVVTAVAALHSELLTTAEAAALLRVAPKTLRKNARKWGLRQSVAFGASDPRYFRTQIMQTAEGRALA